VTQKLWYDRFFPGVAKPGTLCDPHVFNVGDSFTTSYGIFQWTVEFIAKPNAGKSGIAYSGTTLENCDITALYLNGDMRTSTLDVAAVVSCHVQNDFDMNIRTSFSIDSLPGKHTALLGALRLPVLQYNDLFRNPVAARSSVIASM
jgi:hypothetical protein